MNLNQLSEFFDQFIKPIFKKKMEFTETAKLSLAVIFMDLAHIDSDFSDEEHRFIKNRLCTYLSISLDESYQLIHDAQAIVDHNVEQDSFAEALRYHLPAEEREKIVIFMDELLACDDDESSYEHKLRTRYMKLMGVRI